MVSFKIHFLLRDFSIYIYDFRHCKRLHILLNTPSFQQNSSSLLFFLLKLLSHALNSPDHLNQEKRIHEEELLEAFTNLVGLAESNANDFVTAGGVSILSVILNVPLASFQPRANVYTTAEKTIASRCVHTLCFSESGRRAVGSDKEHVASAL